MVTYFEDLHYAGITYSTNEMNFQEFEGCSFSNCNFSECLFLAVTFIDCSFTDCDFSGTKVAHTAFRTVHFHSCKIKDVNFSMSDKLIFEVHFTDCILDFSKFYTLKLNGGTFTNCSLVAVDFMSADLTSVVFDRCDLYRAEFDKAIAIKTDFTTSRNYTIDPEKTKLKKAIFSKEEVKGLLFKHDILIS
jgi:uncharacterized protein YjbI with pentapeptide repeats